MMLTRKAAARPPARSQRGIFSITQYKMAALHRGGGGGRARGKRLTSAAPSVLVPPPSLPLAQHEVSNGWNEAALAR